MATGPALAATARAGRAAAATAKTNAAAATSVPALRAEVVRLADVVNQLCLAIAVICDPQAGDV